MSRLLRHGIVSMIFALGIAWALPMSSAEAKVVKPTVVTVKRFTGILSDSVIYNTAKGTYKAQQPGDSISGEAAWVDFICDPKTINWKIGIYPNSGEIVPAGTKLVGSGNTPKNPYDPSSTDFLENPRVCDHVEVLMYYFEDQVNFANIPDPADGLAISIRRIP